MARTIDQIIREQLGSLMVEVAVLTSQKEALMEEVEKLKTTVRLPDNKPGIKE